MFRNLEAEQARFGMTNQQVADKLGISRSSYEHKKRTGRFFLTEIAVLLKIFDGCDFWYLFETSEAA